MYYGIEREFLGILIILTRGVALSYGGGGGGGGGGPIVHKFLCTEALFILFLCYPTTKS